MCRSEPSPFVVLLATLALCHTASAEEQRVRRELRSLSDSERHAVFNATNIMKHTTTKEGRVRFGPDFISYDELVAKHLHAAADKRCDQAHLGPAFATYHRAFVLQFELSLLSIDRSGITALPYWDYNVEAGMKKPRRSILWSNEWFGASEGDPESGWAVLDGFFSDWRVRSNASDISRYTSPHGLLRSPWNNNPSRRITRHSKSCGSTTTFETRVWPLCLDAPAYLLWYACIDPTIHTWAHSFLGGIWNSPRNLSRVGCYLENAVAVPELWEHGCVVCPARCAPGATCACRANKAACPLSRALIEPTSTYGDFADSWASPNDPIFFFHHANLDRHLMTWQRRHAHGAPTYGFPTTSLPCVGHGIDDVIASGWPFDARSLLGSRHARGANLTNRDVIAIDETTSPYTYDSLE